jgi:prepilin-type N-terminal cleavage/methylation domain-containing protein
MAMKNKGFSLIEIVMVIAIVAIVLTGVMLGLSYSTKSTADSKFRSTATAEAQKTIEFLTKQRYVRGWESFASIMDAGTYCLNEISDDNFLPAANESGCGSSTYTVSNLVFSRIIIVSWPETDEANVIVRMTWPDYKTIDVEHVFRETGQ